MTCFLLGFFVCAAGVLVALLTDVGITKAAELWRKLCRK